MTDSDGRCRMDLLSEMPGVLAVYIVLAGCDSSALNCKVGHIPFLPRGVSRKVVTALATICALRHTV
jgi:hypothetical protein